MSVATVCFESEKVGVFCRPVAVARRWFLRRTRSMDGLRFPQVIVRFRTISAQFHSKVAAGGIPQGCRDEVRWWWPSTNQVGLI